MSSNTIHHTQHWLSTFVIAHNICPFAKREYDHQRIRYSVLDSANIENCLETLISECEHLDQAADCATTLMILPTGFDDFNHYLDLVTLAEELLLVQGYEGIYQIASFHPDYCFAGADDNDPANYTNRSPYPMLHVLRESAIEALLTKQDDLDSIPERNINYMRGLGLQVVQKILADSLLG